ARSSPVRARTAPARKVVPLRRNLPSCFLLELACEPIENFAVTRRVDLPAEYLLGAGHRDRCHLSAKLVAGAVDLDLDLGAGAFELPLSFRLAGMAGSLDDLVSTRIRLLDDHARLIARGNDGLLCFVLCGREVGPAALRGC